MKPFVALLAVVAALVLPSAASALPGDPPFEPRAPAEAAVVAADPAGISVSFTCPQYRKEVYGDPADPITSFGGPDDYQVRFSDAPGLGADGRLATQPFGSDANVSPVGDGTCTALLDTYDTASSPEIAGGRVFWQAYRPCIGCEGQRPETARVSSFDVRATVNATLSVPKRLYSGYLGEFAVASEAPLSGARVVLERRSGSSWRTMTDEGYVSDRTMLYAKLPAGRQTVRAVVRTKTSSFVVATRKLTVRREGRRSTSGRDDGRYRNAERKQKNVLEVGVGGGGRVIRSFRATVTAFCIGPTLNDNRLSIIVALLKNARVAPDGSVVAVLRTDRGGREVLTGKLNRRRFKGTIDVSLSTCNGTRKFTAVRR